MDRCVSAPGKLFLSGEYAVLWGGTALIAAVGPRLAGWVRARDDSRIHLISATGRLEGQATPLGVNWTEPVSAGLLFAARGIEEAVRARGVPGMGFDLVMAPATRTASGEKLGLGGSAQAALISVELSRLALQGTFDSLKVALLAHSKAQADSGSGADVAAIYGGGIVRYRRYPVGGLASASAVGQLPSALGNAPPVDLRRLGASRLRFSFAYSGNSAATLAQIQSIEARLSAAERERVKEQSDQLGRAVEEALVGGDFPSLARATESLQRLLSSLGPLETEAIRQIVAIARSHGAAAKISGAGGGDRCVLFSPDEDAERELLAGLRSRGFWATPLAIEEGMRGEAEPDPMLSELIESQAARGPT